MSETVHLPVPVYRTPDGTHTCARDFSEGKVCRFLLTGLRGEACALGASQVGPSWIERDGWSAVGGWLIPRADCPLTELLEVVS